jgi:ankyrin repeat protein
LTWSIENEFEDISTLLIERGAELNNHDGKSPLLIAIEKRYESIVKCLILRGVDINISESSGGNTALHLATKFNLCSVVQLLLESVENVFAKNHDGHTALDIAKKQSFDIVPHFARFDIIKQIVENNIESVLWNLDKGADVNAVDEVIFSF